MEQTPSFERVVNALKGRIVFWSATPGRVALDAMTAPVGSRYLPGRPVTFTGILPSWRFSYAVLVTLERWTSDGSLLTFEERVGPDGARQTRISDGCTWLVLDASPVADRPAVAA